MVVQEFITTIAREKFVMQALQSHNITIVCRLMLDVIILHTHLEVPIPKQ